MARREERAYREYVSDEQRSQPGCPARELCDESLLRDTRASRQKSNRNPSCWRRLGPSVSGRPKVDDCRLPWYRSQLSTLNTLNISQNAVAAYLPPNRKILLTRRSVLLSA